MTEISHKEIGRHLEASRKNGFSGIYLIYGEPYLCQRARRALVNELIPDAESRQLSLELMDAAEGQGASEAVETAGTFSFFPGPKVVAYKAADLFSAAAGTQSADKGQGTDDTAILLSALQRGLPKNHFLILITEKADKRTRLYKAISGAGTIINCAVPAGARMAERNEQQQVLRQLSAETLAPYGKSLETAAFEHIFNLTGFDPRNFVNNLEKLILYTADRPVITAADASAVLEKTREDPIYLFTGALAERNVDLALYYLDSLLGSGYHPMQLLSAVAGQVRRQLAVKSFIEDTRAGSAWKPSMPFERFKTTVLPQVVEHDKAVCEYARQVKAGLQIQSDSGKDKSPTDMVIAKNPKNPYPVYQVFLQSDRFTGRELGRVLAAVHKADLSMKSTGQSPKAVVETLILEVFTPKQKISADKKQTRNAG